MALQFTPWNIQTALPRPHLVKLLQDLNAEPRYSSISTLQNHLRFEWSADGGPIRTVVRRSGSRVTYKNGKSFKALEPQAESLIELKGQRIVECSPYVKSYMSQPCRIHLPTSMVFRHHIPDLMVTLKSGKVCFIEFKAQLNDPAIMERTNYLSQYLPLYGYAYLIVTEDQVSGIPLQNASKLLRHKLQTPDSDLREWMRARFISVPSMTLSKLMCLLPERWDIAHIYHLMRSGHIDFNNNELIELHTQLTWKTN